MATIIGNVLWEETFEDYLNLAAFPPASEYNTFNSAFSNSTQRLQGASSFEFYGSKSLYPLMRWRCVSAVPVMEYAQAVRWRGILEVEFAAGGVNDHDNTTLPANKRLARYWVQLSEAVVKQNAGTGLTGGAFFRSNAAVTAPGVQVLGIGDIVIEQERARKNEVLGADVWTMAGTVTINAMAGPGA